MDRIAIADLKQMLGRSPGGTGGLSHGKDLVLSCICL
jgi:hypothetical protein